MAVNKNEFPIAAFMKYKKELENLFILHSSFSHK